MDTEKALSLNAEGLGAVTGYVVAEAPQATAVSVLGLIIVILVLINLNIWLRFSLKRKTQSIKRNTAI